MNPVNNLNNFKLSCTTSNIIFQLAEGGKYLVDVE